MANKVLGKVDGFNLTAYRQSGDLENENIVGLDNICYFKMTHSSFQSPLNASFINYTVDLGFGQPRAPNQMRAFAFPNGRGIFISLKNDYGTFYFIFMSVPLTERPEEPRASIMVYENYTHEKNPPLIFPIVKAEAEGGKPFIAMARIEPYVCKVCEKYEHRMKKCKWCWRRLGIYVRYCSPSCQKHDYDNGHKEVCGGTYSSLKSQNAVQKRVDAIKRVGLENELIESGTGYLGFSRHGSPLI